MGRKKANVIHPQTTIFFPLPFFSESLWLKNSTSVARGPPSFCVSAYPSTWVLKCLPIVSMRFRSSSSSPEAFADEGASLVQIEIRKNWGRAERMTPVIRPCGDGPFAGCGSERIGSNVSPIAASIWCSVGDLSSCHHGKYVHPQCITTSYRRVPGSFLWVIEYSIFHRSCLHRPPMLE